MSPRELNDGSTWEVYKRYFTGAGLATELGGGDVLFEGAWFVVVRAACSEPVVAPAGISYRSLASMQRDQRTLPGLRRSGLPARVSACARAARGPARVPVRAGARDRRGRGAPAVARTRGPDAPPLARPGRGQFYETFYCASVTRCYPGARASGRGDRTPTPEEQELCEFWRDHELRLLAAEADRHRRRPRHAAPARRQERHASASAPATSSAARSRSRSPSLGCEQLAERPGEPPAGRDAVALVRQELAQTA